MMSSGYNSSVLRYIESEVLGTELRAISIEMSKSPSCFRYVTMNRQIFPQIYLDLYISDDSEMGTLRKSCSSLNFNMSNISIFTCMLRKKSIFFLWQCDVHRKKRFHGLKNFYLPQKTFCIINFCLQFIVRNWSCTKKSFFLCINKNKSKKSVFFKFLQ